MPNALRLNMPPAKIEMRQRTPLLGVAIFVPSVRPDARQTRTSGKAKVYWVTGAIFYVYAHGRSNGPDGNVVGSLRRAINKEAWIS